MNNRISDATRCVTKFSLPPQFVSRQSTSTTHLYSIFHELKSTLILFSQQFIFQKIFRSRQLVCKISYRRIFSHSLCIFAVIVFINRINVSTINLNLRFRSASEGGKSSAQKVVSKNIRCEYPLEFFNCKKL